MITITPLPPKGRGSQTNPAGRFEEIDYAPEMSDDLEASTLQTRFFKDHSKTLLVKNDSPDVPFDIGLNVYRGCEHGCIYCYARPYHEYLGLSAGLDFESRIFVKENAPILLRNTLSSPRWQPKSIGMSGITDPYQPAEKHFGLTRDCLEVLADFRNPVGIVTKNHLITRDLDLLRRLAAHDAVAVAISITTLDPELSRRMEPRASSPARRLAAIRTLSDAGIPVMVNVAPVIPGLTDHEMPDIISEAVKAGANQAMFIMLRLPFAVKDLFQDWLEAHYPDRKDKVLNRIREIRGGKLNNSNFGERMRGSGIFAEQVRALFHATCRREGISERRFKLSKAAFRRSSGAQLDLFE